LSPTGLPWQRNHQRIQNLALSFNTTITNLPEKPIIKQYLQLFLNTLFRLLFLVVGTVLFQANIRAGSEPGAMSSEIYQDKTNASESQQNMK
jgi:hypothetical protein